MTGDGFLAATLVTAVATLVVLWALGGRHDPTPHAAHHEGSTGVRRPHTGEVSVTVAYRAAIARARQQTTGQLLAIHHAGRHRCHLTVAELLEWAAAHHVLVAERHITPPVEVTR